MKLTNSKRTNIYSSSVIINIVQILIAYMYFNELDVDETSKQYDGGWHLLTCKFIASVSFHMTVHSNICNSLEIMKYCLDHHDKFVDGAATACFWLGFLQLFAFMFTNIVNLNYLGRADSVYTTINEYVAVWMIIEMPNLLVYGLKDKRIFSLMQKSLPLDQDDD